jgi:type II secretory pathway component PulJ
MRLDRAHPRVRRSNTSRRQRGHTLIELMVVTTLMTLLTFMVAQVWRPLTHSTATLRDRAIASTEISLAAEFLRKDFGGAVYAESLSEQTLNIRREFEVANRLKSLASGDLDPGVEYRFADSGLMRRDFHLNEEVQVAHGITSFVVRRTPNGDLNIELISDAGRDEHKMTLVWSP